MPDEIHFDYAKAKPNRFADRLKDQQILVALDPDVAAVFGNAEAVNRVLRALIETMPPALASFTPTPRHQPSIQRSKADLDSIHVETL